MPISKKGVIFALQYETDIDWFHVNDKRKIWQRKLF